MAPTQTPPPCTDAASPTIPPDGIMDPNRRVSELAGAVPLPRRASPWRLVKGVLGAELAWLILPAER